MPEDLVKAVESGLLPAIASFGFRLADSHVSDSSFDNAWVELGNQDMRIRIARERSQLLVAFGPASEPGLWFDSDIVFEHLGLSTDSSFPLAGARGVCRAVAAFIAACQAEVSTSFNKQGLAKTKRELQLLQEQRAKRLFG
jgi:hypothetical protein